MLRIRRAHRGGAGQSSSCAASSTILVVVARRRAAARGAPGALFCVLAAHGCTCRPPCLPVAQPHGVSPCGTSAPRSARPSKGAEISERSRERSRRLRGQPLVSHGRTPSVRRALTAQLRFGRGTSLRVAVAPRSRRGDTAAAHTMEIGLLFVPDGRRNDGLCSGLRTTPPGRAVSVVITCAITAGSFSRQSIVPFCSALAHHPTARQ